jgi:hypothetical protein
VTTDDGADAVTDVERLVEDARRGDVGAARALVTALWHSGATAPETLSTIPILAAAGGAPIVFLLGLLAEADSEAVREAVAAELDTVLAVVPQADEDESLRLALIFLLAHFPARRERIRAAIGSLDLEPDDRTRLDRCLDPDAYSLGRAYPSPADWTPTDAAQGDWVQALDLTREQQAHLVALETQCLLAYAGAKAFDALWGVT